MIDDFLTLSTDQIIDSNVFISKMHVNNIQSKVFNDMKRFAENVAVMGRDNIIESMCCLFRLIHLIRFVNFGCIYRSGKNVCMQCEREFTTV